MFANGDRVVKHTGDTHPSGVVLGTFVTTKGKLRVVVELDYADLLHIYSPEQLRPEVERSPGGMPLDLSRPIDLTRPAPIFFQTNRCAYCGGPSHAVGVPCPGFVISCDASGPLDPSKA